MGADGTDEVSSLVNGRVRVYWAAPRNPRARPISIIAESWLVLTLGDHGGRWELEYTDEDLVFARRLVAAVVAGRIEERRGLARSRVTVRLDDGEMVRETGYSGCAALLVPQPGWTRWGRLTRYEPYRS